MNDGIARDIRIVDDPIPVFDTARFEHMQRIAASMARSPLVPESLRGYWEGEAFIDYPVETIIANCLFVINQAVRWGMDPYAVIQCASVIKGRITYEGKVVAAALDTKYGVRLRYAYSGEGNAMSVVVSGLIDGEIETIEGSVDTWKTTGRNSPWMSPANYRRQLAYRGAREWVRIHKPAALLGVYTDDEFDALVDIRSRHHTIEHRSASILNTSTPKAIPSSGPPRPPADPETAAALAAIADVDVQPEIDDGDSGDVAAPATADDAPPKDAVAVVRKSPTPPPPPRPPGDPS